MKRYDKKYTGMKKAVLLFVFSVMVTMAWSQEYQMRIKTRLMYGNNSVSCDSWFLLTARTVDGEDLQWYENIDLGDGSWGEYEHTFTFPASRRVDRITIETKRETSDCTTRDGGTEAFTVFQSWYPCHSTGVMTGYFPGYNGQSSIEVDITPLSLPTISLGSFPVYEMQTEASVKLSRSLRSFTYTVTAIFASGSETEILSNGRRNVFVGSDYTNQQGFISLRRRIVRIRVTALHLEGGFITRSESKEFEVIDDKADFDTTLADTNNPPIPFAGPTSSIHIRFGLPKTPLTYSPGTGTALPSSNLITLTIPESNNDPFTWKYSLDGGNSFSNMPASFGKLNKITFSGETLFGANWRNYLFVNVIVKAIYDCTTGAETNTFTLRHLPSAPGISKVEKEKESCFGFGDGWIKVTFARPLYSDELLYVFLGTEGYDSDNIPLDANNAMTIPNLTPGIYDIKLLTTYPDGNNGYSNGDNHKRTTEILRTERITGFDAVSSHVHCREGEDGRLRVSAAGGTTNYNAYLMQNGLELQHITLSQTSPNSFTNLAQGTYVVKLKDTNGCDPKEDNGSVRLPSYTINEPAEKVWVDSIAGAEPLGFGLTNGYVRVRTGGGTNPYTFTWTDKDLDPLPAEPPVAEGTTVVSTLNNIGKGIYHIRAEDDNYVLVSPQTDINVRGCFDTLTLVVDEPPLLEVALAEHRYVQCFNYKNGEVVAHGTGGRPYLDVTANPYDYAWYEVTPEGVTLADLTDTDSIATDRHSAFYRVMVTDRNGITAWSEPFELVQPDSLEIKFNTSQLLCNGDHNGTSQAIVTGGTRDYIYAWSTEAAVPAIDQLAEGVYSLVVRDARNCITLGQTEVEVPDGLEVDEQVVFPTCQGYQDGSITLTVKGGRSPYVYDWDHDVHTPVVEGLGAGLYHVRVTDNNHCFVLRDYTLEDPALFGVDLGPDRVLCKEQTLDLNVGLADAAAQYAWTKDGAAFASTAAVQLAESGTYAVAITDSKGCGNQDAVKITRDDSEISASIIVASRAPQAEKIRVANISFPFADEVEWILPEEATVIEETPDYIDLSFTAKGEYNIGMTSYRGACEMTTYSKVRVVDKRELTDYVTPDEPYIQQFIVSPNPNDGHFAATVELREAGNFALLLHNAQGEIIDRRDVAAQSFVRLEFDVTAAVSKGVYVLQLVTTQGYATFKVIIQ